MKKKILIIALVCILAGVAAFYIVKVNNMYPQEVSLNMRLMNRLNLADIRLVLTAIRLCQLMIL